MAANRGPASQPSDTTVDLLVIGSGTGMAAALAGHEAGLSTLIVEKTQYVGGSTARSGGAFWVPGNPVLAKDAANDSLDAARAYVRAVVGDNAPAERGEAFLDHGAEAIAMLERTTPMKFFWAKGYSDYHPENPGGSSLGRTCECRPFDASVLGSERKRLRPGLMASPLPMPITGADYKWLNLIARKPLKGFPRAIRRLAQGVGGLAIKREYMAGGQALAAGMFAGVVKAGIPVWTETSLVRLVSEGDRVTGAVLAYGGNEVTVTATRGVILAAGGFDHDMEWRHKFQSPALGENASLGAEGNTGDAIKIAQEVGAGIGLMDQSWWFPAFSAGPGRQPVVMLAERSLPGSLIVDQDAERFANEAKDYMSFGQGVLKREQEGRPIEKMWLVFDQRYRNSYILGGGIFPRQPLPGGWYKAGIAHSATSPEKLAESMGVSAEKLRATLNRFNGFAAVGNDPDFKRGQSAYDRYYGDPTQSPNPNLRSLDTTQLYAIEMVLSDLGTCGGVLADENARVLREDGSAIDGLYAIGNTAANAFGKSYPGAGATIGQGLVYGYIAAHDAARRGAAEAVAR
ncbi:3-ketosteroid-delta-1-dehydrogenase [Prescottella agglutinans]|uniref:3-oxosteroid 1-dehydrogenase n=1 Tax=Prescottella agglutinans TaxID=1644129 RepID=A0ABT6MJ90_9NOCA|nr:3-ketosteroid-delta-1-dehydrogenase [Prescottella agglutinans]MDH6284397.1 3-oxosteroid 1-dehydrogenase [Prescottella agglutinans]